MRIPAVLLAAALAQGGGSAPIPTLGANPLAASARDTLRVLRLLAGPPQPNAKLFAVAKSLPKHR